MLEESYEQQQVAALLTSLGELLGLKELAFDEDNNCLLEVDGKLAISITFHPDQNSLVIHHCVGTLPDENRLEIVEQLLEANLFWSGTRGATLSIERSTGQVFLARTLRPGLLNASQLGTAIIDIADTADYWSKVLETGITFEVSQNGPPENIQSVTDVAVNRSANSLENSPVTTLEEHTFQVPPEPAMFA